MSEARAWLGEFWNAQEAYDWAKTRSAVGAQAASNRMLVAVAKLEELGVVEPFKKMPTLDDWRDRELG